MSLRIGTGIGIGFGSAGRYWDQQKINDSCLFFASDTVNILNKVSSTFLPNQVTGSVDYLTVTGEGLNARYRTPNAASYKTADSDNVFWRLDSSESVCDGNRLINYDFSRILIKYLNIAPYTILWIAILKPGVIVTDGMKNAFDLSVWWSNIISTYGQIKENRSGEQRKWSPLYENISAYWKFDEQSGNMIDSWGSNHGVQYGTDITRGMTGKIEKAIHFNRSGYFNCGNDASVNITGPFTVAFWLQTDVTSAFWGIFCKFPASAGGTVLSIGVTINKVSINSVAFSAIINDTGWHHIVCIYDGAKLLIYTNGIAGTPWAYSLGFAYTSSPLTVGGRSDNLNFKGKLDEMGFWNGRALSQQEVDTLFNLGNGLTLPLVS
jgi:hypothetical protein